MKSVLILVPPPTDGLEKQGCGTDKTMATAEFKSSTGQGMRDAIDEACHLAADALRDVAYPAKVIKVGKKDITIILRRVSKATLKKEAKKASQKHVSGMAWPEF